MFWYMLGIFGYFIYKIISSKDKGKYVLFATAYITGAEVFLRMTKTFIFYETGKYAIMFFSLLGIFYLGFKKNAFPYVVYIVLLLPAILISIDVISFDANFRNTILFNLSGPLCLTFAAIFCFGRTDRKSVV